MNATASTSVATIEGLRVGAFRIPTDEPESDGTLQWRATTLVVVEITAAGTTGLGYTYADAGVARTITDQLTPLLRGRDADAITVANAAMFARLRNLGRQGASAMAVSAVDCALWDLKAKRLGLPLVTLLGPMRSAVPLYGSGGFTSYSDERLRRQFEDWADDGIRRFKMKVGRNPSMDRDRVRAARAAIGNDAELFVDANSAYTANEALMWAEIFAHDFGVTWLEEPLSPQDLEGLRFLRGRVPAGLELAEGEYGSDLDYFRRLMEHQAADVVMADLTRCGGVTGFLQVATLCEAWKIPLSTHCAPALHLHAACAAPGLRHAEYFHDHVRIERELFDGTPEPVDGALHPDLTRPGHGLVFKWDAAARYAI